VASADRQRFYRLNAAPLKSIYDWVIPYEEAWSERFERLDVVLERAVLLGVDYLYSRLPEAGRVRKERTALTEQKTGSFMPHTDEEIEAVRIGPPNIIDGSIFLADYDPAWPRLFEREAARIRATLGSRVLQLEHVGSTSVPGLAAKPLIDMLMVVSDSSDEGAYVTPLEAKGYVLRIREPDWYEHRVLKGPDTNINLHVLSAGCPEIDRMLLFRDHLRRNDADRNLYERTKRELATRRWKYVQNYADAKTAVVEEILTRAQRMQ
jgi:GrpB-like predicted nucleotidyltransferase (UPF0157 family)